MSYISRGTISVEFNLNDSQPTSLFFVPECDYSIKNRGHYYAVFVRDGTTSAIIRPLDGDGRVPIQFDGVDLHSCIKQSDLTVGKLLAYVLAPSAGMMNAKVEVQVVPRDADLRLTAILPAK